MNYYLATFTTSVFILLVGCNMATGEQAIAKMNQEEKTFLSDVLMKINSTSAEAELTKILGVPKRGAGTARPIWLGPGNDESSQVAIYYDNGKIFKIRWMKVGSFIWERDIK